MKQITKYYRVRVYVGPVWVDYHATLARQAGMTEILEGTEHIHATVASSPLDTETDKLVFRERVGQLVYGQPNAPRFRDVEIIGVR